MHQYSCLYQLLSAIKSRARYKPALLFLAVFPGSELIGNRDLVRATGGGLKFGNGEVVAVTYGQSLQVQACEEDEGILFYAVDDAFAERFAAVPGADRYRVDVEVQPQVELREHVVLHAEDKRGCNVGRTCAVACGGQL